MEKLLLQDKKGVSEMIGYVLLVLIAVIISIGVYSYFKLQIPKGEIKCEKDATLIIQDQSCRILGTAKEVTLTLSNKGLYHVDAAYIRLGGIGKKAKTWINDPEKVSEGNFYLTDPIKNTKGLQPGKKLTLRLPPAEGIPTAIGSGSGSGSGGTIYELEVQPAVMNSKGLLGACEAIVSQEIICN